MDIWTDGHMEERTYGVESSFATNNSKFAYH